jgi:hypothetical protein
VNFVEQAAEALSAEWWKVYDDDSRPTVHDEANALAAAGLLRPEWATPEAKAVLDRLAVIRRHEVIDPELASLFDAYVASTNKGN